MLVRTLPIKHDDQNTLTAVLLLSFAIPELNQNFLAYSLNEDVDDNNSRVYLVSLHKEVDDYSLHTLTSDADRQGATQVFRQILREIATGETDPANASFYLLDLGEQTVTSGLMKEHHTLNVAKDWIVKLFNVQPEASSFRPPLETGVPVSHDDEIHPSSMQKQPCPESNSEEQSDEESVFQDLDAEHFLTDVQTTLEEFSELAEKLTFQKNQHQSQQETLASRESQLQERERLFNQKKEVLLQDLQNYSEQQLQQERRQSELDLREKALQRKAMELSIKLKKLEDAKNKLNSILKALKLDASRA